MPSAPKDPRHKLLEALALRGWEDYHEGLERVLNEDASPVVQVYITLLREGFLSRQQLRENLPGLSVATLDRATGELVEKYFVKQWRKGQETFYAPRRPSMNRPERQLEVQRQNPDTILLANRRGLETVLKTRLLGSLLRVSLLQSALREQTRLRLMDMVQNTRELFVVYIGRGKPDTIIVTHWKKLPYLFKDTWTQVKLTAM